MAVIRRSPDVIILDIQMPRGTGFAVLRWLKTSTKTNRVPIIVVSGTISADDEQRVRELSVPTRFSENPWI
jgi:CheY-like chemotaxis protein